ncbi:uncharacterized protein LOC129779995 [Toxorhynchites rutilus septentrionalis]|uniref:uncharacterized protein LOC129779995 n=1 Tax=Toxorhynchites rutilus septentrionalis TaxID=329112 RepID=UPI0024786A26|nr:uncharacterized protein LOC129779995 [Toxorhynchites rutilus septentrionalis]
MQPIFNKIPPEVNILLYADDVILIVKDKNHSAIRKHLRKGVKAATDWALSVGFAIAPTKSKLLHACFQQHRKRGRAIKINDAPIPRVRKIKILGILVDAKLNFKQHLNSIKNSCSRRIQILRILGRRLKRSSRSTLLKVGSALIISKLFFGLGLTSLNVDDIERILGPTYNEVVRQSSGVFITSPISSIMAEAGCLPFRLALTQRLSKLAVRLLENNPEAIDYPVVERSVELLQQSTGFIFPKVSCIQRASDRPWHAQPPKIDNQLRNAIKAGTIKNIVLPQFQEFIANRYNSFTHVFTDGSKDGNSTGAGVAIGRENYSYCLPSICSVFSAEAFALNVGLSKTGEELNTLVLTDSASCLDALHGGRSKHPWIQSVEKLIGNRNVQFSWIPGHSGIPGNEQADHLAKQGLTETQLDIPIPAQDVTHAIKSNIWQAWELEWNRSRVQLRQIKNTPGKYPDRTCASDQRILSRIRIGHTRLTHSHLLKHNPPPICTCCGIRLTVQHILIDCRAFAQTRSACGINGTLADILAYNPQKEELVIKFLKDSNLYNEI